MNLRSETVQRWWPTTQSLDLVEGNIERVAAAVQDEVSRFLKSEQLTASWETFPNLDAAFGATPEFANVPTFYLVIPTHSKWNVLWNNGFLCDGYDSLCSCLTKNHGFTTIHWSAHDELTSFQPGAAFHYRRFDGSKLIERSVQAAQQDKRWLFFESGQPLPEENVQSYLARRKKDRLNEQNMSQFLARLGANPWSEQFYSVSEKPCFVLHRKNAPSTIIRRPRSEVLQPGK
jgi:hypothetical protein